MKNLLALLLTLLALGCSLDTSGAPTMLAGLSCDWERGEDIVTPARGGSCWSAPERDIALTPTWVDSPCSVDEFQQAEWGHGEPARVWTRLFERLKRADSAESDPSNLEIEIIWTECL